MEPLTICDFIYKEHLTEMLNFFNKAQHYPSLVTSKRGTSSNVCLLAQHKEICSGWFKGNLQNNIQETSPFHQE